MSAPNQAIALLREKGVVVHQDWYEGKISPGDMLMTMLMYPDLPRQTVVTHPSILHATGGTEPTYLSTHGPMRQVDLFIADTIWDDFRTYFTAGGQLTHDHLPLESAKLVDRNMSPIMPAHFLAGPTAAEAQLRILPTLCTATLLSALYPTQAPRSLLRLTMFVMDHTYNREPATHCGRMVLQITARNPPGKDYDVTVRDADVIAYRLHPILKELT
jgi:hypothetical protein